MSTGVDINKEKGTPTEYRDLIIQLWKDCGFTQGMEADEMKGMVGFLRMHYGQWELSELRDAFLVSMRPDGFDLPDGRVMCPRFFGATMKRYVAWKKEQNQRNGSDALDSDLVYGAPPAESQEARHREIVANAYRNFCEGKSPSLVPSVLYGILVERGRIAPGAYEVHMTKARGMEYARNLVAQSEPKRGGHEKKLGDELDKGWKADWIAKDMAVRVYFDEFKNKRVTNGNNNQHTVPAVQEREACQQR